MLLDPCIKMNVLTDTVLELMNMSENEVIQLFQDQAEQFTPSQYKKDKQVADKDKDTNDIKAMYRKKKVKITLLQEDVKVYLNSKTK